MKLAIALGLLLCAIPAKADEFQISDNMLAKQLALVTNNVGTINCPCGPTVESFGTSFDFDTVSQSVSGMTFNSNGPLGPFTFSGVTTNGVESNPADDFTWSSSMANIVLNVYDHEFVDSFAPDHSIVLTCLSTSCVNDFNGIPPGFINDLGTAPSLVDLGPSNTPAPTPEPSSLLLMGSGIAGLSFLRKFIASAR